MKLLLSRTSVFYARVADEASKVILNEQRTYRPVKRSGGFAPCLDITPSMPGNETTYMLPPAESFDFIQRFVTRLQSEQNRRSATFAGRLCTPCETWQLPYEETD